MDKENYSEQIFTEERSQLAVMNFSSKENKMKLKEMIKQLANKMHERGDKWLLKDCTKRDDSWYNRHKRTEKKFDEKKEIEDRK